MRSHWMSFVCFVHEFDIWIHVIIVVAAKPMQQRMQWNAEWNMTAIYMIASSFQL